jgi:DNA-binding CsgD family transcriptional regulator
MAAELSTVESPTLARNRGGALVRGGADLVFLAEELYLRLFRLTMCLTLVGCGLSIWFGAISRQGPPNPFTFLFAVAAALFATAGLVRPAPIYRWLRMSDTRVVPLAAFAAAMVLANGPDSPSWWVALPLLWVIADVGSITLALRAAFVAAGAYLLGTHLGGEPLISRGDAGILAAAVALPANTLIGCLIAEVFAMFALRLHQLEQTTIPPRQVANLAAPRPAHARGDADAQPAPAALHRLSKLTARQLEVALLLKDGLQHSEIAACLGISVRQVDRHISQARERAGASTASELVAMLVTGRLVPGVGEHDPVEGDEQ